MCKEMVNDQQGQHRCMDIGIHGQNYMDKGIWTYVYGHRCMHIGIWTKVYRHGYMDKCCAMFCCVLF